jgi:hypothetical protein
MSDILRKIVAMVFISTAGLISWQSMQAGQQQLPSTHMV